MSVRRGKRKRVLVLSFSFLHRDSRIQRQVLFLRNEYDLTVVGFSNPDLDQVKFIPIGQQVNTLKSKAFMALQLKARRYEQYYWSWPTVKFALAALAGEQFDLVIANDIETLPLGYVLCRKGGSKLVLDAHEYKPREYDDRFVFRFFLQEYWNYLCKTYISFVDGMTTVCEGIAAEYEKVYGVKCRVVTNAPFYEDLQPSEVNNGFVRMVHHGSANKSRRLENMLLLMNHLDDRFRLDVMLINSNPSYLERLRKLGKGNPRIRFIDPVPPMKIAETINNYDVGLYFLYPRGFNDRMALPNKIFEFIQGRLLVAIWPSQEMSRIVERYRCGVVSEDCTVSSMARILNRLTSAEIASLKQRADKAARVLCAESNKEIVLSMVRSLIG